jgi:hypothetical protein
MKTTIYNPKNEKANTKSLLRLTDEKAITPLSKYELNQIKGGEEGSDLKLK